MTTERHLNPAPFFRLLSLLGLALGLTLGLSLWATPSAVQAQDEEEEEEDDYDDEEYEGEDGEDGSERVGGPTGSGRSAEEPGNGRTWAVIPVGLGSLPSLAGGVADRVRDLLTEDNEYVLSAASMAENGEAQYGDPPPQVDDELVPRIISADAQFAESVHARQYEDVAMLGGQLLDSVEPQITNVNRTEEAITALTHVCLFLVESHNRLRHREEADATIRRCLRLLPGGLEIPRRGFSSSTRRLFSRTARDVLNQQLQVSAPPAGPDCFIRVNGQPVGQPPEVNLTLVAGDYAVQADCGSERGRIHAVHVGPPPAGEGGEGEGGGDLYAESSEPTPPATVTIERNELVLRSGRELIAVYSSQADLERAPADVTVLARALHATHVLAILETQHTVWINAFVIPEGGSASAARSAEVTNMEDPAVVARALNVALGRSHIQGEAGVVEDHSNDAGLLAGWVLAGVGGATLVGSLIAMVLTIQEAGFTEDPMTRFLSENDAGLEVATIGLLGGGLALTAVGVALVAIFSNQGGEEEPLESASLPRLQLGCSATGCSGAATWQF